MRKLLQRLLLLVLFSSGNSVLAQTREPIVVDLEDFPVSSSSACPVVPYDRGVSLSGGVIATLPYEEFGAGKVYRSVQPYLGGFLCYQQPVQISFDETSSEVSFDLYTTNNVLTITDDTGWSRTIAMDFESDFSYAGIKKATITVPSEHVRTLSIHDPCDYFGGTACGAPWSILVDNIEFTPERPCVSVTGDTDVLPNPAGSTSNSSPVVVEVTDCEGHTLSGIAVRTSITVDATSGGHTANHISPRPTGGLRDDGTAGSGSDSVTGSSEDGRIPLQFVPPEAGGTHAITSLCIDRQCYYDPPLNVDVKIPGLGEIPPANVFYTLVEYLPDTEIGKNIGDTAQHKHVNHNLTDAARENLWRLAFNYAASQAFQPIPEKLHINDASLPMGGIFDISGAWNTDHVGHRKGIVVDIRGNDSPGAVPEDLHQQFVQAAFDAGGVAVFERRRNATRRHYHVLLIGDDQ